MTEAIDLPTRVKAIAAAQGKEPFLPEALMEFGGERLQFDAIDFVPHAP